MTGVANLHLAVRGVFPADERGVVWLHRTFGKKLIGPFDQFAHTQTRANQAAKNGVQATHQQGRGHTLSRNIADEKIKITVVEAYQITVVAADGPGRLVTIRDLPAIEF